MHVHIYFMFQAFFYSFSLFQQIFIELLALGRHWRYHFSKEALPALLTLCKGDNIKMEIL